MPEPAQAGADIPPTPPGTAGAPTFPPGWFPEPVQSSPGIVLVDPLPTGMFVPMTSNMLAIIDRLHQTGLYGRSREQVVEEMLARQLRDEIAHLPRLEAL